MPWACVILHNKSAESGSFLGAQVSSSMTSSRAQISLTFLFCDLFWVCLFLRLLWFLMIRHIFYKNNIYCCSGLRVRTLFSFKYFIGQSWIPTNSPQVEHTGICPIVTDFSKLRQELGYNHFPKESLNKRRVLRWSACRSGKPAMLGIIGAWVGFRGEILALFFTILSLNKSRTLWILVFSRVRWWPLISMTTSVATRFMSSPGKPLVQDCNMWAMPYMSTPPSPSRVFSTLPGMCRLKLSRAANPIQVSTNLVVHRDVTAVKWFTFPSTAYEPRPWAVTEGSMPGTSFNGPPCRIIMPMSILQALSRKVGLLDWLHSLGHILQTHDAPFWYFHSNITFPYLFKLSFSVERDP